MNCTDVIPYLGAYLDSELDVTTTIQIQAHLSRCPSCCERFDQEQALESRIAESLKSHGAQDDGRRWQEFLLSVLPRPQAAVDRSRIFGIRAGSAGANWISLVASLVFLAALASAGLGLRHSGQLIIPGASWRLQRYAQIPNRPMGDLERPPGAGTARMAGDRPWWTPDA